MENENIVAFIKSSDLINDQQKELLLSKIEAIDDNMKEAAYAMLLENPEYLKYLAKFFEENKNLAPNSRDDAILDFAKRSEKDFEESKGE